MKIVVISDDHLKEELLAQADSVQLEVEWVQNLVKISGAVCYIDLLFDYSAERINILREIAAELIIVNAVNTTGTALPENFVRIAGWSTFLSRTVIEAATINEALKKNTEDVFSNFNKSMEWTPDIAGFISPRIISMLINEAYYTLEDKVSGKSEIDTAMKLGTRYPFGPFEWSKKIGLKNVDDLLTNLSSGQIRYTPAALLKQEASYL